MDRKDAADQQRIEAYDRHRPAAGVLDCGDRPAREGQSQLARRLLLIGKAELAHVHQHLVALAPVGPGSIWLGERQVAEAVELGSHACRGKLLPHVEIRRLRIHARGERPATALELLRDATVQHRDHHEPREHEQQSEHEEAALEAPARAGRPLPSCHGVPRGGERPEVYRLRGCPARVGAFTRAALICARTSR
jgi:hypothetical protein